MPRSDALGIKALWPDCCRATRGSPQTRPPRPVMRPGSTAAAHLNSLNLFTSIMPSNRPMSRKKKYKRSQDRQRPIDAANQVALPTCPDLHGDVEKALLVELLFYTFHDEDDDDDCIDDHDTNIMGKFVCSNKSCGKKWSSRVIAITIRHYPEQRYNARVYHQHCKRCGFLGYPTLDKTYSERVSYRIKKWCGVEMERPPFSRGLDNKRLHESDLHSRPVLLSPPRSPQKQAPPG